MNSPKQNSGQEDSRVKTSATPAREKVSEVPVPDCSLRGCDSFAKYDQNTSSWRTSRPCLVEDWATFWENWPQAGTMQAGYCYRLEPLVRHISDAGFSLLPSPEWLFPTVTCGIVALKIGENCGGTGIRATAKRNGTYIARGINPEFQEWLMGFPVGWTDIDASETP